jgi:uncharacterized protein (TIGR00251 family)
MTARIAVSDTRGGARFLVRVTPRASRTTVAGLFGEGPQSALRIALAAPPIEGRANDALIRFLAELLGVPRSAISLASGQQSRNKTVLIRGQTAAQITPLLERALGDD